MNKTIQSQNLKLIYVMLMGTIVSQILSLDTISSAFFYVLMALTLLLGLSRIKETWTKTDRLVVAAAFAATLAVLIDSVLYKQSVTLSDYTKFISFLLSIIYFTTLSSTIFNKRTIQFVLRINTFISIFFIVNFFVRQSDMYLLKGNVSEYLTFQFTNPNLVSLFLLCCAIVEFIQSFREKKTSKRVIYAILACIITWFIYETGSRNALLAISFFLIFVILYTFFNKNFQISSWVAALISIFPLFFSAIYMLVVNRKEVLKFFSFLIRPGKNLNSRISIWNYALSVFSDSPIIGSFMRTLHGTSQSHMHNSHLDILSSYGCIVLILFCMLLYCILLSAKAKAKSSTSRLAVWGFAAVLIAGVGETAIFSGGLGIYAYAGMLLLITNESAEESSVKVSTGSAQRKKGAQKRPCKQTVLQGQGVFTQS